MTTTVSNVFSNLSRIFKDRNQYKPYAIFRKHLTKPGPTELFFAHNSEGQISCFRDPYSSPCSYTSPNPDFTLNLFDPATIFSDKFETGDYAYIVEPDYHFNLSDPTSPLILNPSPYNPNFCSQPTAANVNRDRISYYLQSPRYAVFRVYDDQTLELRSLASIDSILVIWTCQPSTSLIKDLSKVTAESTALHLSQPYFSAGLEVSREAYINTSTIHVSGSDFWVESLHYRLLPIHPPAIDLNQLGTKS